MEYGIISLIPIAVMLGIAIITRKCISSMVIAILVGCVIIGGTHWLSTFIDQIYTTGSNENTVWIVCLMCVVGVLVALFQASGGAYVLVKIVEKKVKGERNLYLWTWLLSALLFIDDMLRSSVIGQMTPLFDKFKVPRASVAYYIDTTSTTITSLVPLTNWAVFFMGIFAGFAELEYIGSGFDIYVRTIPFNFYAIAALIVCFGFTMGWIPKIGGMKKAYERVQVTGELYSEASIPLNPPAKKETEERDPKAPIRLGVFVAGILILTLSIIITGDVLTGFFIGVFSMTALLFITRICTWKEIMTAAIEGEARIIQMPLISFFVYMFKDIITTLQVPEYVISVSESFLSPAFFPLVTFIACCVLTFCSGSTWGVTVVYALVAVPMSVSIGADPTVVLAAILSGEAFGAHICFYCDYTVFASAMAKIDNIEHAFTQIPYGIIGGIFAAIGFLITGIVMA
ncbi:MAG: Na+/H+ antiporter NhaC family protein [Eubacteriales bacterium]|nr:Na+/H+ antiporter NhaC family protein [Clostridia bacterium]MDD4583326.1 Na+/H+ antiporter NhaC family protein [Eubacteriales bacterium]